MLPSRRQFLRIVAAAPAVAFAQRAPGAAERRPFSFVLLGDLHFDRLEHHDLKWLKEHKPGDLRQVENYSRITREITPRLFATVREVIAERNRAGAAPVSFVLQVGDLVEGLCGSEELAAKQNREALEFVRGAKLGVPFLFTKGNHDVTGPGANEAFAKAFHPFLNEQVGWLDGSRGEIKSARYTVPCGNAEFVFFDAYDSESLTWFESVAAKRSAEHFFVIIHPPVVPYGARATWHLYSSAKDRTRREKLLELLARQQALVLGGHIHKFNTLTRVVGRNRFGQFAISSIINSASVKPKDVLAGVEQYNGDQIRVEPDFSRGTEQERRAVYEAERNFVKQFEYADLPGYAVVTVNGTRVTAKMFSGVGRELFRDVNLSGLLWPPPA